MAKESSRGACFFCRNTYTGSGMTRHLAACKSRQAAIAAEAARGGLPSRLLHLYARGAENPEFWLHVEARADARLRHLDRLLRDVWLECCGHLSLFRIGERRFVSLIVGGWSDDLDMEDYALGDVLTLGEPFSHEYDFGSTTYLDLKVVAERQGVMRAGGPLRLLARNDPPDLRCQVCGQPAARVCPYDATLLCDGCAGTHVCGDEVLLPVVNSPRLGVCAYTGPR